ncbi:MAG: SDR family NAD(P)-dependent oxidoreductase [Planctomycetota bacterium]|nr:SDR family NAD(P)-dependent oxidoreductase [Planctomycetota bacterium]
MAVASSFDLHGRAAVVTGSSSGIGRAIALRLAQAGANVVVHARRSLDAAEHVAAEIRGLGAKATVLLADLVETAQQDRLVQQAWDWQGGVDIWVNNAGADVLTGEAAKWPFERKLQQLWDVDVVASLRLSRAIGAKMQARGGAILNIGWDQAEHGMAGDSGELFATTKGAVMAATKSLALSLAPAVRVNCVAPGWIQTAWGDRASDYWQQRAVNEAALRRWGTPEDIADAALFLCSPASQFMTGQVMAVNGGRADGFSSPPVADKKK